ncbi:unnamed protein product [Closterium sp. Naga37s-1]|nr:unnamed protein product [Closterium sp. Naga37s-1]
MVRGKRVCSFRRDACLFRPSPLHLSRPPALPPPYLAPFPYQPRSSCLSHALPPLALSALLARQGKHGLGGRMATRENFDAPQKPPHPSLSSPLSLPPSPSPRPVCSPCGRASTGWAGGRMATREVEVAGKLRLFDHAVQFFTVTDSRFQSHVDRWAVSNRSSIQSSVDRWLKEGALRVWEEGRIATLQAGGAFSELPSGSSGGGGEARRLVREGVVGVERPMREGVVGVERPVREGVVGVERPMWIGKMRARGGKWVVEETGRKAGEFDFVVIAHNGGSIWASIIAFESPLLANGSAPRGRFDAAFVEGVPAVAWMCNNTAKLAEGGGSGRGDGGEGSGAVRRGEEGVECWTVLSSAAYGKRNKVPQENIPLARAARVKEEMLEGVAAALGRPKDSLPAVLFHKIQLWGAALPLNAPTTAAGGGVDCIMDASTRVGLCGDWLLAPSVQAAAVSGLAMADKAAAVSGLAMADKVRAGGEGGTGGGLVVLWPGMVGDTPFLHACGDGDGGGSPMIAAFHEDAAASDPSLFSVGLDASFAAVPDAHDIGAFPDTVPAETNGSTRGVAAAHGVQVVA